jgi:DivIVA domain-containing protein
LLLSDPPAGPGSAFSVRLRGYDRAEVETALGRLETELEQADARASAVEAQVARMVDERQELLVRVEGALTDQRELVELLEHLRRRYAELRRRAEAAESALSRLGSLPNTDGGSDPDAIVETALAHAREIDDDARRVREALLEDLRGVRDRFEAALEVLNDPDLATDERLKKIV